MGRHRDFYDKPTIIKMMRGETPTPRNGDGVCTQLQESYVLIFTLGDADMLFRFSYPYNGDYTSSRKHYVTHPMLTLRLGAGTLLVFASTDDFFYCHEAAFAPDATGTRLAFVFRWMNTMNGSAVLFDASSGNMIMTRGLREKEAERKRKRATTAANDRRSCLRAV